MTRAPAPRASPTSLQGSRPQAPPAAGPTLPDARRSSAGCAGPGASSPACAWRCCCSCCSPSPPCPGSVCPQRAQDTGEGRAVPRRPPDDRRRGSTGSGSSTSTPRSGSRRSTSCCSSRWSAASCRAPRRTSRALRGRPPRAPRRFDRFPAQGSGVADAVPGAGRRRRRGRAARPAGAGSRSSRPGPRRHPRRGRRHRLGVRGARLPARDRQPRLPPGPRRPARLRGDRAAAALPRAGDRREGRGFANAQVDYDTFEQGTAFTPRAWCRSRCASTSSSPSSTPRRSQSRDFTAHVTLTEPGRGAASRRPSRSTTRSTPAAPRSTCRATGTRPTSPCATPPGEVAFSGPTPFLPQDEVYTSRGVVKVPDVSGDQEQIGLVGYLLPTATSARRRTGPPTPRVNPQPDDPRSCSPSGRATSASTRRPAERVRARRGAA